MIAIIDSGSTKSDWVILGEDKKEITRTQTIGFNPYFVSSEDVLEALSKNETLGNIALKINRVYFYGAGCSIKSKIEIIEKGLKSLFKNAKIEVKHDLLASVYALYNGNPFVAGILGTGSNACFFDGKNLKDITPSTGYVIGDEGSGNQIGKKLLQAYFSNKFSDKLKNKFDKKYNLGISTIVDNVYKKPLANRYLASFSTFVSENIEDDLCREIVSNCMKDYFDFQVKPYEVFKTKEVNLVGSIAYHFKDFLLEEAEKQGFTIGRIIQKPIDNLVSYHIDNLL